ncbi:MAG: fructose-bisphosphatase class II [Micrococcales bacterium]|nr:fructose-bisphosphatase class II [Micrococcales bacterium]
MEHLGHPQPDGRLARPALVGLGGEVGDEPWFCATGVTDGELLPGVRFDHGEAHTSSLVLRARSGTSRVVRSRHHLERLSTYSAVDYYRNA